MKITEFFEFFDFSFLLQEVYSLIGRVRVRGIQFYLRSNKAYTHHFAKHFCLADALIMPFLS